MKQELLQRYFANQVNAEEEQLVMAWIDDPANKATLLSYIEQQYAAEQDATATAPFEVLFKEALSRENRTARLVPLRNRRWIWASAAAACLFCLAAGTWIGYRLHTDKAAVRHTWVLNSPQDGGTGNHTRVLLSDGSEVYLNADSRLTIEKEVNVTPVVYLEGEASFNLPKEGKGVTIKTKELVTTAKDSRLNISAFPKDSTVTVSVQKGLAEVISADRVYPLLKLRIPKKDSALVAKKTEDDGMPKAIPLVPLRRPVVVKANESITFEKNNKTENSERERAKGASDSVE